MSSWLSRGSLPDAWLAPLFDDRKGVQEMLSVLLDELSNGFGFFLKGEFGSAEPGGHQCEQAADGRRVLQSLNRW